MSEPMTTAEFIEKAEALTRSMVEREERAMQGMHHLMDAMIEEKNLKFEVARLTAELAEARERLDSLEVVRMAAELQHSPHNRRDGSCVVCTALNAVDSRS